MELKLVKDEKETKLKECGNCMFFFTNGWVAPSGRCNKHPEFDSRLVMDYENFPKYATVCNDWEARMK